MLKIKQQPLVQRSKHYKVSRRDVAALEAKTPTMTV
jgi:hypothetical protein